MFLKYYYKYPLEFTRDGERDPRFDVAFMDAIMAPRRCAIYPSCANQTSVLRRGAKTEETIFIAPQNTIPSPNKLISSGLGSRNQDATTVARQRASKCSLHCVLSCPDRPFTIKRGALKTLAKSFGTASGKEKKLTSPHVLQRVLRRSRKFFPEIALPTILLVFPPSERELDDEEIATATTTTTTG